MQISSQHSRINSRIINFDRVLDLDQNPGLGTCALSSLSPLSSVTPHSICSTSYTTAYSTTSISIPNYWTNCLYYPLSISWKIIPASRSLTKKSLSYHSWSSHLQSLINYWKKCNVCLGRNIYEQELSHIFYSNKTIIALRLVDTCKLVLK